MTIFFIMNCLWVGLYQNTLCLISVNIDECEGVNCNDGTCVDGIAEYTCSCDAGFEGDACEGM